MRKIVAVAALTASGVLGMAGMANADSGAAGSSANSPGVVSGNTIQAPIHIPANVCGDSVNVIGVLNPAAGNGCANT